MSTRYEGCDADSASVDYEKPGAEIGEYQLKPGEYGLTIGYGEVFYITGTPDELVSFATELLAEAQAAKSDAQGPLSPLDFYVDEDHEFVCPRDGEAFGAGNYETLGGVLTAVREHVATAHNPAMVL